MTFPIKYAKTWTERFSYNFNSQKSFQESWIKEKEIIPSFRRNGIEGNEQEKFVAKEWAITNLLKIHSAQKFIIFVDELLNEPTWKMNVNNRDADYENRWTFFLSTSFTFSFV